MRYEKLDLNLLVALEVLLEEKNITKSAYRLHLSQSATSGILSRLRDYFDDDLLVQMGKQMHITPLAAEMQQPVSEVLSTIRNRIIDKKINTPELSNRNFKIIASDYIMQVILADLLAHLNKVAPGITFEFMSTFAGDLDTLAKQGPDLIIAPTAFLVDGYSSEEILHDEFVCIADKNNSKIHDKVTVEQFSEIGHVTIGYEKASQLSIEKWMVDTDEVNRRVEVIVNDFSSMFFTVINTERVALAPKRLAEINAKHLPIKVYDIPFKTPQLSESMMWHQSLNNDPLHKWLREQIANHALV